MDRKEAIQLLKKHASDAKSYKAVLAHTLAVEKYALWLASRVKKYHEVDIDFISTATILHDIGRFKCPPWKGSIRHGIEGGKILRKEGLPERYAKVCENHLGPGITKADIKKHNLKIPLKDYLPVSTEEKIISYADIRFKEDKLMPSSYPIKRFSERHGPEVGRRVARLHEEIQKLYKPRKSAKRPSR